MSATSSHATLPTLTRALALSGLPAVDLPPAGTLTLPETAVQFGTGAFLRGFVDHFVDAANRRGEFNGRVVAVGSTGSGRDRAFTDQDGLYTLVARGLSQGAAREEIRVVGAVSRALSAATEWDEVLKVARAPQLRVVFSNTTEVGIALDEGDRFDLEPPRSFPGKLTRFLFERARAFDFAAERGVVVVPCELIEDNGHRLREIVLALADRWALGADFRAWIEQAVPFCNTLVDRIVPGAPADEDAAALRASLGYRDELLTACELYRLFVIEGDPSLPSGQAKALRDRLGFVDADPGVVITDDARPYRERKVRLLNGAHTITVSLALLAGCETVRDAMTHELVGPFVRRVMLDEIAPTLQDPAAEAFALAVLDRFANPYIRHALFDITLQATMKMRVRVVPTIERSVARTGRAPALLSLGLAAFLLFARGDLQERRRIAGLAVPADEQRDRLCTLWATHAPDAVAGAALSDATLWGTDLTQVPGLLDAVRDALARLLSDGVERTLEAHLAASLPTT
ncbi:tagaturonate reductase [Roseisolibacter agri]|uniref:Altronate oxidoreductase n=1 Tax=Roseisolibacter agri TaxID=2014610 RepID=A0AA37QCG3_9BACT|nr:tagaturonate reductase [Roseisolibacter agri]GLC23745.1 altronate oxidoreductase [Roseisolibacter agri]